MRSSTMTPPGWLAPRIQPGDRVLLAAGSSLGFARAYLEGVPLTHAALATSIRAAMAAWCWTGDDVLVHALPLYHQHGLGGAVQGLEEVGGAQDPRDTTRPGSVADRWWMGAGHGCRGGCPGAGCR